jgi:endonuclease YncB( thermonuclease family)
MVWTRRAFEGLRIRLLLAIALAGAGLVVSVFRSPTPVVGLKRSLEPARDADQSGAARPTAAVPQPSPIRQSDDVALRRAALLGPFPMVLLRVLDGDTIEARVRVWFGQEITTLVRLRGIDAPELKARCGDELRGAEAARDTLAALLGSDPATIEGVALDKYGGRVVASVHVQRAGAEAPVDVAKAMLAAGMARPYNRGRRENWCPLAPMARG